MKKNRYLLYMIMLFCGGCLYFYLFKALGSNCTSLFNHDPFYIVFINIFIFVFQLKFVIMPFAKIIDGSNFSKIVIELLILRGILLICEYVLCVEVAFLVDVIVLFACAFFVMPIIQLIRKIFFRCDYIYDEYLETDLNIVKKYFSDIELLKKILNSKYIDINTLLCEFNYKQVDKLCSSELSLNYKNDMKLLESAGHKKYFTDFICRESKIYKFNVSDNEINIVLVSKMSGIEYTLDKNNVLIEGNNKKKKNIVVKIYFTQKIYNDIVKECPNCGASINKKDVDSCDYCGTMLHFKTDELLITRINRVYDK